MVDTIPQVMFTFFKKHANDLNGKTAILFTTHEGLGLANCVVDVKAAFLVPTSQRASASIVTKSSRKRTSHSPKRSS